MDAPNCTAAEASTAGAQAYTAHAGLNCYEGAGGVNIDNSGNATTKSVADCEAFCDATAAAIGTPISEGMDMASRAACKRSDWAGL